MNLKPCRVIRWEGNLAFEGSQTAIWIRPRDWRIGVRLLAPEKEKLSGVFGSPQRLTWVVFLGFGPIEIWLETRPAIGSSACIPWGNSW